MLQLPYSLIFSPETLHTFPTYLCLQKGVQDFFKFCLDLELLSKTKKKLVSVHLLFTFLLITQDVNKIKKNPENPFVDIGK